MKNHTGPSFFLRGGAILLLALCCCLLSGCVTHVEVQTVLVTPEIEETPAPTPEPTVTPVPVSAIVSTPPKFENTETLPPEKSQIINPKKATYERFGIDKEENQAFEDTIAGQWKLPVIHVCTKDQEYILSREIYTSCIINVFNCPDEWRLDELSAGIRVRGNSSGFYGDVEQIMNNRVPYRIKFDKKTNLLGLSGGAKSKSWVLLRSGYDLIRNDLAFRFGRAIMGGHAFCSDAAFVHVYVNDTYQGLYTLCEQCQVGENRVNINEPREDYEGIDMGYYLVIDNIPDYPRAFRVEYGGHKATDIEGFSRTFVSADYSIKSDVYTKGQVDFISQYINNVFEIVYQACEKNKYYQLDGNFDLVSASFDSAEETVENVLDIESVVDMYLLYEIMHDYDVGEGSFYMCVDFSENSQCRKLQFTSPWDFNWTCEGRTDRYWAGSFCESSFLGKNGDRTNPWFVVLIKQDWFKKRAAEKWTALAANNAIEGCMGEEINILEQYSSELRTAQSSSAVSSAYNLIVWLQKRLKWMDTQFLLSDF